MHFPERPWVFPNSTGDSLSVLQQQPSSESSGCIVGVCPVMVEEYPVIAAVAEEGTAKPSHGLRGTDPA